MSVFSQVYNTLKSKGKKVAKKAATVFKNVKKSSKKIEKQGGQVIVGELLEKAKIEPIINATPVATAHPCNLISEADVIKSTIANMCSGNCTYEAEGVLLTNQDFYKNALGVDYLPSISRLRQRIDQIGEGIGDGMDFKGYMDAANMFLLQGQEFTRIESGRYVPLDIDLTPLDQSKSHKENVSRTYKGFDGYGGMEAYFGREGYLINSSLYPGKQHSQKDMPAFLRDSIHFAKILAGQAPILVRLDSGNDAKENMGIMFEEGVYFIIKRNLRQEDKQEWLSFAQEHSKDITRPREGKTVYKGTTWKPCEYKDKNGNKCTKEVRIVYEITERQIDKHGQCLLVPDIEVNTFWDNTGLSDELVIQEYHSHGESEQYHSELKSELCLEKLSSGKFNSNIVLYLCGMLAYNILRIIGMLMYDKEELVPMREKAFRRRLGTVIENIIHMPVQFINSGRALTLDIGCCNSWGDFFIFAFQYFVRA